jgi:hypothetical protein
MLLPSLTFVANGSVELPSALGCNSEATQRWCLYGNNGINPALSSPVHIKPFPAWFPRIPYEYPDRCVERSDYPTWEIRDLVYNHSSPHQQNLSLSITNLMNGLRYSCSVTLDEAATRADAHATRWSNCTSLSYSDNGITDTQLMFDSDYGVLGIKETWKCRDNIAANDEPYVKIPELPL